MESTLIWSYGISLTLDATIDFTFSPRLRLLQFFSEPETSFGSLELSLAVDCIFAPLNLAI